MTPRLTPARVKTVIYRDGAPELPVKVLEDMLQLLPRTSIKNARLTCKHWRDVGARYLFRRTYFAPQQEILDLFAKITSDKAFASNVEELIYDARLFWRRFEDPAVYKRACLKGFPDRLFVDHRTLTGEDTDGYEGDADDPFGTADHSGEQQHAIVITSD